MTTTTLDTIRNALPALPQGLSWRVSGDDEQSPDVVTVSLWATSEGSGVDFDEWGSLEELVNLAPWGLTLRDNGPEGGPFVSDGVTYDGGTYQRWARA